MSAFLKNWLDQLWVMVNFSQEGKNDHKFFTNFHVRMIISSLQCFFMSKLLSRVSLVGTFFYSGEGGNFLQELFKLMIHSSQEVCIRWGWLKVALQTFLLIRINVSLLTVDCWRVIGTKITCLHLEFFSELMNKILVISIFHMK